MAAAVSLVEAVEDSSLRLRGAGEVLLRKCIISARIVVTSGSDLYSAKVKSQV